MPSRSSGNNCCNALVILFSENETSIWLQTLGCTFFENSTSNSLPPSPQHKHTENKERDGQTGPVLRQARACTTHSTKRMHVTNTCPYLALTTIVTTGLHSTMRRQNAACSTPSLPIRGIRSCGVEALSNLARLQRPVIVGPVIVATSNCGGNIFAGGPHVRNSHASNSQINHGCNSDQNEQHWVAVASRMLV